MSPIGIARDLVVRAVGWLGALVIFAIYTALALRVDLSTANNGLFWSDEATYYMQGQSLVHDGDLAYRQEDLRRVYREFPQGPSGLFLKRGQEPTGLALKPSAPFIDVTGTPDPDTTRLFFGKAFIYPAFAAPFVWLAGTPGFLIFNALLLALAFWAGYRFLLERTDRPLVSLALAGAFLFASAAPVYAVWIMPELFNFTLGVLGCFFWLFKHARPSTAATTRPRFLQGPGSDYFAAVLFGIATYSKITNVVLALPMLAWLAWRGEWRRTIGAAVVLASVVVALFAVNVAVTGDWNYQGGDRATFYPDAKGYPFDAQGHTFEGGADRGRSESRNDAMFDRDVFWSNLRANAVYFFIGRYGGLVPYFFPAVFAMVAMLVSRPRQSWQWFVLGGVLAHILLFIVTQPYTYLGSGGAVGDRYFMGAYGACLFILPPIRSLVASLIPWIAGSFFVAKIVVHPVHASVRPADAAKSGPLRLLPVELTQVLDLPINTEANRAGVWFGHVGETDQAFQIYHLDDSAWLPEADRKSFWVRGASRTEFLIKVVNPARRVNVLLSAGRVPTTVTVDGGAKSTTVTLAPFSQQEVQVALAPGFPFKKDRDKAVWVYVVSISSTGAFRPSDYGELNDTRSLGVRARPTLID